MVVSSAEVAGDPSSVAILTPDGVLHPLRGDVIDHVAFSGDDENAYVLVTDAAGQLTLWDRADTPALLATLDARAVTAWDPNGRWLATTSTAGDAYLVDIGWLGDGRFRTVDGRAVAGRPGLQRTGTEARG